MTGKIRRILCSLLFKFDKLTGWRQTFSQSSLSCFTVKGVGGGGGVCVRSAVATGHRCHADELSDNNRVKRGNK